MTKSGVTYSDLTLCEREILDRALRSGATRRDLMKMLLAAGMIAGTSTLIVEGATKALADTPKRGGKLRLATYASSTADTLDPARGTYNIDYVRMTSLFNGLTRLDDTLTPQNELAEAIETSDARLWHVKIRPDVRFHDGSKLTADDVVFSITRHKDPAVASNANALAQQFQSVTKVSDTELTIELVTANADLPAMLATESFLIVKNGTTDFTDPVGTGAFSLVEFSPGNRSIMRANTEYWKTGGGPYIEELEIFAIADEAARANALLAGDVDVIANVNPRNSERIKAGGCNILQTSAGNYVNFIMRLDVEPGNNRDFVQAMKHLFDRETVKNAVYRGFATIGNDQPIPPVSRYYRADLEPAAHDPELAKSLLEKAGLLNTRIPIIASTAAKQSVEMAMVIQQAASKIGLTLDVERVPADGYWANYWGKSPICFGDINPRPTPDAMFSLFYQSDASRNESKFQNERFDSLLLEARGTTDEIRRKEMYGEMQELVSREAGTVIPTYIDVLDAYSAKVKGFRPLQTGALMGNAFAEYVWIED